jgi:RsmE family RNA methyltransferase
VNLILLDEAELPATGEVTLADERAAHLQHVLHVVPGQRVRIGILDGALGSARVSRVDGDSVTLVCEIGSVVPSHPAVDLLLALPRPKVMRRMFAQLAALGVGRIMLSNAARVERNYFDTHVLARECHRPLLVEGLQQAQDTRVPLVTVHRQLKVLIEDELDALSTAAVRLVADPGAASRVEQHVSGSAPARVLLAVGPEGGWNDFERNLLAAHGFLPIAVGPRTLRSDTACIALLALIHDALRGHQSEGSSRRPE